MIGKEKRMVKERMIYGGARPTGFHERGFDGVRVVVKYMEGVVTVYNPGVGCCYRNGSDLDCGTKAARVSGTWDAASASGADGREICGELSAMGNIRARIAGVHESIWSRDDEFCGGDGGGVGGAGVGISRELE